MGECAKDGRKEGSQYARSSRRHEQKKWKRSRRGVWGFWGRGDEWGRQCRSLLGNGKGEPQLRTKLENGLQLKCLGLVRKARYDEQENGWGANQTRMGVSGDDRLAIGIGGSSAVGKSGAARRGCRLWGDRGGGKKKREKCLVTIQENEYISYLS